ncbi:hypothetical protein QYE76_024464 [Lolium multiflorum]|uniref:Uncharacterized protein n=1 Tax=Lolium multiflorum TaxID=4521 RepID=A0AAD8VTB3_LOLMU|nr:hypothetical protein QYE76_024464 [Lolium multiflorum]
MAAEDLEWERSKISNQDVNTLKRLGLMKKEDAIRFPSEESYPNPPMEYRVSFVDHLIRGLSAPIHDFLRGLLFVYGIQLHQTILLWLPFLLFLRMEKSKNRLSLPKTPKVLLFLKVKSQVLTNLRLPMKKKLNLKPVRQSLPPAVSPRNKRKRNDAEDSGTSKAEKVVPSHPKAAYDPYIESLVSSDDEEEVPTVDVAPRTSTSHTVLASDTLVEGEESSPPQQNVVTTTPPASPLAPSPKRTRIETIVEPAPQLGSSSTLLLDDPMIKELLRIGSQFIGYREYASRAEEKLAEANKRADALAQKLEQSEAARKKAELVASEAKAEADEAKAKAASVEELQKRLEDAESALNEHKAAQASREQGILKRLKSQSRRTHTQTNQDFDLENPVNDPLLDALTYLELHGSEIREGVANANAGLSALFPYFFPKKEEPPTFLTLAKSFNSSEDLGLKMRQENMKIAVESTVALTANRLLIGQKLATPIR